MDCLFMNYNPNRDYPQVIILNFFILEAVFIFHDISVFADRDLFLWRLGLPGVCFRLHSGYAFLAGTRHEREVLYSQSTTLGGTLYQFVLSIGGVNFAHL